MMTTTRMLRWWRLFMRRLLTTRPSNLNVTRCAAGLMQRGQQACRPTIRAMQGAAKRLLSI